MLVEVFFFFFFFFFLGGGRWTVRFCNSLCGRWRIWQAIHSASAVFLLCFPSGAERWLCHAQGGVEKSYCIKICGKYRKRFIYCRLCICFCTKMSSECRKLSQILIHSLLCLRIWIWYQFRFRFRFRLLLGTFCKAGITNKEIFLFKKKKKKKKKKAIDFLI